MKLEEATLMVRSLERVMNHKGTVFSKAVVINYIRLGEKIKVLQELLDKEVPEYNKVVRKVKFLKKKFDEAADEDKEAVKTEHLDYINEMEDIINRRKKKEEEYLKKDIDVNLYIVEEKDLPDNLTAGELLGISEMIKFK